MGVVKTRIPGIIFSENLSRTAQVVDKITVVRSITGRIPDHAQAAYQMFTGYLPTAAISRIPQWERWYRTSLGRATIFRPM